MSEFLVIVGTGLRETAARGVGMLREAGIREQLELLAGDTFPDVRLAVVRALGALADPRSAPVLIHAWNQQNDAFTREAILEALGRTWSPEGAALLTEVAGRRKNDLPERVAAARSIAFHAPPDFLDTLRRLDREFDDGPRAMVWQLRTLSVAGRIRLEDPEAPGALADLLEEERRVPDHPSGGERELGEMVARARNLEAARMLLESPKAGPRYAGALAVREMARQGVDGAADLGREAAGRETNQIVSMTLSGI
jgi:HEAT repeat protein